jgi:acyl-CoA thioester hydrolase
MPDGTSRPAPNPRTLRSTYRRFLTFQTRFADVDTFHHLNNVAIDTYYDEGRARLHAGIFGPGVFQSDEVQLLVAEVRSTFLAAGQWPEDVDVGVGVLRVGRSSWTLGFGSFQCDTCLGTSDAVMVYARHGRSEPLPDEARAALESLLLTDQ